MEGKSWRLFHKFLAKKRLFILVFSLATSFLCDQTSVSERFVLELNSILLCETTENTAQSWQAQSCSNNGLCLYAWPPPPLPSTTELSCEYFWSFHEKFTIFSGADSSENPLPHCIKPLMVCLSRIFHFSCRSTFCSSHFSWIRISVRLSSLIDPDLI